MASTSCHGCSLMISSCHFSPSNTLKRSNSCALSSLRPTHIHGVILSTSTQALNWERLGPERKPYSDRRRRRLAVQEAATAVAATLQPAVEPVMHVTIVPREKFPLGQTVLKVNEERELTHLFTRRYLEEQLLMVLAGTCRQALGVAPYFLACVSVFCEPYHRSRRPLCDKFARGVNLGTPA